MHSEIRFAGIHGFQAVERFAGIAEFGQRIMAEIHFAPDERLFDQSGGRLFPGSGTQIDWLAIQESGDANFVVDLGLGDDLVADGDDDPVDDFRGGLAERRNRIQKSESRMKEQELPS